MKLSFLVAFFAAIAVLISPLTANAQTPAEGGQVFATCEEWQSAADGIEGASVVSGNFALDDSIPNRDTATENVRSQFIDFQLFELTFPWGVITNTDESRYLPSHPISFQFVLAPEQDILFLGASSRTGPQTLTPDASLGIPIGVSLVSPTPVTEFQDLTYNIYDGDTLLNSLSLDTRTDDSGALINDSEEGFIVPRGSKITRVEIIQGIGPDGAPSGLVHDVKFLFADEFDAEPPVEQPTSQESLTNIGAEIDALIEAIGTEGKNKGTTNKLKKALEQLDQATSDDLFEEGGNRLSENGAEFFDLASKAIKTLQTTKIDEADELAEQILAQVQLLVDNEIANAIDNAGAILLIDQAQTLSLTAETLSNVTIAIKTYEMAWELARTASLFNTL